MFDSDMLFMIQSVAVERGLDEDVVFESLQEGLAAATRREIDVEADITVTIDRTTGEMKAYRHWTIVDDEAVEHESRHWTVAVAKDHLEGAERKKIEVGYVHTEEVAPPQDARILAQAARQTLLNKLREEERKRNARDFSDKVGRLLIGTVKKVLTRGGEKVLVELPGGAEAILPKKNQLNGDRYSINDNVQAVLGEIEESDRGPQLILSRTSSDLVRELLIREVPEIVEQVIEIKAIAREAGGCTKIAVKSNDARIDPVGACVGMRGLRVQQVMSVIGDERVDIIPWNADPIILALRALGPFEPERVDVDDASRTIDVVMPSESLARAIGSNGQNVRLASALSGWAINILDEAEANVRSEQKSNEEVRVMSKELEVSEAIAQKLIDAGFKDYEAIVLADSEELAKISGLDAEALEAMSAAAAMQMFRAETLEEVDEEAGPSKDLLDLEHMVPEYAFALSEKGIRTLDDFADLDVDEVMELLQGLDVDESKIGDMIMAARAKWLEESGSDNQETA